jgi:hypothetical protein
MIPRPRELGSEVSYLKTFGILEGEMLRINIQYPGFGYRSIADGI